VAWFRNELFTLGFFEWFIHFAFALDPLIDALSRTNSKMLSMIWAEESDMQLVQLSLVFSATGPRRFKKPQLSPLERIYSRCHAWGVDLKTIWKHFEAK